MIKGFLTILICCVLAGLSCNKENALPRTDNDLENTQWRCIGSSAYGLKSQVLIFGEQQVTEYCQVEVKLPTTNKFCYSKEVYNFTVSDDQLKVGEIIDARFVREDNVLKLYDKEGNYLEFLQVKNMDDRNFSLCD